MSNKNPLRSTKPYPTTGLAKTFDNLEELLGRKLNLEWAGEVEEEAAKDVPTAEEQIQERIQELSDEFEFGRKVARIINSIFE